MTRNRARAAKTNGDATATPKISRNRNIKSAGTTALANALCDNACRVCSTCLDIVANRETNFATIATAAAVSTKANSHTSTANTSTGPGNDNVVSAVSAAAAHALG